MLAMNLARMAAALMTVGLVAGCGGAASNADAPSPKVFTIHGKVSVLAGPVGQGGDAGCAAAWTKFGIEPGGQVVVSNPRGVKVAVGRLDKGQGDGLGCFFYFHVASVPEGFPLYTVRVASRPPKTYPRAQLNRPVVFVVL